MEAVGKKNVIIRNNIVIKNYWHNTKYIQQKTKSPLGHFVNLFRFIKFNIHFNIDDKITLISCTFESF